MASLSAFEDRAEEVAELVEVGCSVAEAAREVGVATRTIERWLAKGRAGTAPYTDFAERVDMARFRRSLPDADTREAMTQEELDRVISEAARAGNVQAMKLVYERLRREGIA